MVVTKNIPKLDIFVIQEILNILSTKCYADKDTTFGYCKIDSLLKMCLDFYSSTYEETSFYL